MLHAALMQSNAQFRPPRPRQRVNRAAHLLMPPFRRTNAARGSATGLYSIAYRIMRDHLDRVRFVDLVTISGVHDQCGEGFVRRQV